MEFLALVRDILVIWLDHVLVAHAVNSLDMDGEGGACDALAITEGDSN